MTEPKRVKLDGFEEALAGLLAAEFKYPGLEPYALAPGRNVWVQDIPEEEEIKVTSPDFDPKKEPVLGILTNTDQGLQPSPSSGSRHEWSLRFVLRYGAVQEEAKEKLEALLNYLATRARGKRAGKFLIKGLWILTRPVALPRAEDDHCMAQAMVKFMGVSIP